MNKRVECVSDEYSCLTKGNIYNVSYEFANCIGVTNNLGKIKKYPIEVFRKLTKQEEVRREVITDKTKPTYYGTGFDVIDFCQKNNLDFMQGNVIKYVTRYKEKNGKEDLLKAREYIDRIIKEKYKEV